MTATTILSERLASLSPEHKAPDGNARSFFNPNSPIDDREKPHRLLAYPVDPETGVPHLLRIYDIEGTDGIDLPHNYDHAWFIARDNTFRDLGGKALRKSMGQLIPISMHQRKNRLFNRLSHYPVSDDEIFISAMNGLMGVVSPWVVDLSRPGNSAEDFLVLAADDELQYLTNKERYYREGFYKEKTKYINRNIIGQFFVSHAVSKGIPEDVSKTVTEQFMDAVDKNGQNDDEVQHRRKLIGEIIHGAMKNVANGVRPIQRDLVNKGFPKPKPNSPVVLMWDFVDRNVLLDYQPLIYEVLKDAA